MDSDDARVRDILTRAETIAVVGLSDKPERDSNEIARYLQSVGYRIVPVNPLLPQVLGEPAFPSLSAIPPDVRVDIADVFRRSDQVVPIVQEAIDRRIPTVWLQLGVANAEAAARAGAAGSLAYFENRCIMVEHRRLKVPAKRRPA
ncbi:MAG: CoA-binding protein [Candidatus Lutacidiplasmatales archaeon]|jgi:hypothetical protein